MKMAFVGAVEGSAVALKALAEAGMAPDLVITLPPDAARRHSDFADLSPLALQIGSELLYTCDINGREVVAALTRLQVDLTLVMGWSQICGEAFRSAAQIGNIGFHPAPLPRMRGRAVIPWTILLGEKQTAATLFWLDGGVDSGPILLQQVIGIEPGETARTLYDKQIATLGKMLPEAIRLVRAGSPPHIVQDESQATYCAKRTPEDGIIDWHEPADSILRLVRAVGDPYPGAFTYWNDKKLILDAAEMFPDSHRYIGLPGQIQIRTDDGFLVRCGDGACLHITAWRLVGGNGLPRPHTRLGSVRS